MNRSGYSWVGTAAAGAALLSGAWTTGLANGQGSSDAAFFHTGVGILVLALAVAQAGLLWRKKLAARAWSSVAVGLLLADGILGALAPPAAVLHACLAPFAFTALVMTAAVQKGKLSGGDPDSRSLAARLREAVLVTAALAALQVVLGVLYRHKIWGILPHMGGALAMTLLALVLCAMILQRIPNKVPLRTAAMAVLSFVLTQVTLGIAAFVMRLLDADGTLLFNAVASLHVATGSLVLASTAVLASRTQKIALGESQ
jgi:hypothetical protein